ncbi:hypothetical protein B843_01025 [Corynebacterium vitaeruminis DSM 20294]|uniref:Phage head-tail adaptor n=1 Tax=Corynebacterium vitaeruminis DSM 20294 TaxID=1224164 RepID=W5XX55_9CORY|nr:hypothetical protein B843_01025 [Corynebacterium vitaeruminis DSM 20294]
MVGMATVIVERSAAKDRHGDTTAAASEHEEPGARIAWAGAQENLDHMSVLTTAPTVYFKRRAPDIVRGDVLIAWGRRLRVKDVQPWEHPRIEDELMGTVVICEEVR